MQRREFIRLVGAGVAAWPLAARAQQGGRMRRIGVLLQYTQGDPEAQPRLTAFQQGLEKLGWTDGRNVRIDYRWAAADLGRMRNYAADLVAMKPDVILAQSAQVLATLQNATREIPIVFVQLADPVELGFVNSLAHPGGNITGFNSFESSIGGKWLEVLKEITPSMTRAAAILHPENPSSPTYLRSIEAGARLLGVQLSALSVRDATEIDPSLEAFARLPGGGLIVLPGPFPTMHRGLIATLASRYGLPSVYPFRFFAASGGLLSYGVDQVDQWRRAVSYIDRILKGEKPADLPVQQPTKFELVVNLKTAKAMGLTIPETFLVRADEVIE